MANMSLTPNWALRPLILALSTTTLLVACGGGGGGGDTPALAGNGTGTGVATAAAFPRGMALGSPTALVDASSVVSGGAGISNLGLSTSKTLQQGLASSLADAVATGRVSLSGLALLSANALFDTTPPAHASCFGPAVAYQHHDDLNTNGTLPSGEVAMWTDMDAATAQPCGVAELNNLTQGVTSQSQQGILLMAALRMVVAADSTLQLPDTGGSVDLTARANTLLSGLLNGISVSAASYALNSDGSEYSYRLVLTRGSGATAQALEIKLLHTPADTDTHFAGTLQMALSYLSSDASIGCSDQRDNAARYKVARLSTLGYNRQDGFLSLRLRSGQYCGNAASGSTSHLADLAELAMSGELEPTSYLSGSTRGNTRGWRQGFVRMTSDVLLSSLATDFVFAWQDQPQGGIGHARMFAGHSSLDAGTQQRTLALFHGYTDDISVSDGTMLGMICNVNGPGSTHSIVPRFQYQLLTLGSRASAWALSSSHIRYAPTNSCDASAAMSFDADGNGALDSAEGASFSAELQGLSNGSADVQEELQQRGFTSPVLLL
jgi:hypothetical protein